MADGAAGGESKNYDTVTKEDIAVWTEADVLTYFEAQAAKYKPFEQHREEYRKVLEGCDGKWLVEATHEALKALATSKGDMYCFKNKLYSKKFLVPLGLAGYNRPGTEPAPVHDRWAAPAASYTAPQTFAYTRERAERVVEALSQKGIQLMCFDFDLTIVSYHTKGHWLDPAEELFKFVRPVCRELMLAAARHGKMHLACTTFSGQDTLILKIFTMMLAGAEGLPAGFKAEDIMLRVGGVVSCCCCRCCCWRAGVLEETVRGEE